MSGENRTHPTLMALERSGALDYPGERKQSGSSPQRKQRQGKKRSRQTGPVPLSPEAELLAALRSVSPAPRGHRAGWRWMIKLSSLGTHARALLDEHAARGGPPSMELESIRAALARNEEDWTRQADQVAHRASSVQVEKVTAAAFEEAWALIRQRSWLKDPQFSVAARRYLSLCATGLGPVGHVQGSPRPGRVWFVR